MNANETTDERLARQAEAAAIELGKLSDEELNKAFNFPGRFQRRHIDVEMKRRDLKPTPIPFPY